MSIHVVTKLIEARLSISLRCAIGLMEMNRRPIVLPQTQLKHFYLERKGHCEINTALGHMMTKLTRIVQDGQDFHFAPMPMRQKYAEIRAGSANYTGWLIPDCIPGIYCALPAGCWPEPSTATIALA